jgi:hypothetical protein
VPGVWQMHNRKLINALDQECDEWVEFDSVSTGDIRLYGLGNTDRMLVESMPPDGRPYEGMTLRLFDPQEKVWRIWWTSSRYPGVLEPPVVGRFEEDGVGRFYCDDSSTVPRSRCGSSGRTQRPTLRSGIRRSRSTTGRPGNQTGTTYSFDCPTRTDDPTEGTRPGPVAGVPARSGRGCRHQQPATTTNGDQSVPDPEHGRVAQADRLDVLPQIACGPRRRATRPTPRATRLATKNISLNPWTECGAACLLSLVDMAHRQRQGPPPSAKAPPTMSHNLAVSTPSRAIRTTLRCRLTSGFTVAQPRLGTRFGWMIHGRIRTAFSLFRGGP